MSADDTTPPQDRVPLEYDQRRQPRKRQRLYRAAIIVALVVVAAWAGMHVPGWLTRIREMQWAWAAEQRVQRCMDYDAPANQLVWDNDPHDIERLTSGSGAPMIGLNLRGRPAAASIPPAPWSAFFMTGGPTSVDPHAVAFLHARTDHAGNHCLVCIEFVAGRSGHGPHLAATVVKPGTLTKWPQHFGPFVALDLPWLATDHAPFRLHWGEPDPSDASRFTIPYQLGDETGVFDGRLERTPGASPSGSEWNIQIERHATLPSQPAG